MFKFTILIRLRSKNLDTVRYSYSLEWASICTADSVKYRSNAVKSNHYSILARINPIFTILERERYRINIEYNIGTGLRR